MDPVVQKIVDMHNIVEDDKRAEQAEYMYSLIEKHFTSIDKERAVAELEKYLSDENDAVVYWTAMSLSQFGKDAKTALPKLKEVLKIKEKLIGSKTSASGIRFAISRIED
jgi:HEAT repeat protein